MRRRQTYKVAGHLFLIDLPNDSLLWDRMQVSYGPFEVFPDKNDDCIFSLAVCKIAEVEDASLVYSNKSDVEPGFVVVEVYETPEGHYFEFTQPGSQEVNARLSITNDFSTAFLDLSGRPFEQWMAFNTSVDFCYLLATAGRNTLLAHASSLIYEGKAYLFLGKSGTGKSTHSRMWQTALPGVILMNDDHPVIRVENGTATAYGSPWSGKTQCYKNISAPIGGVIRICRAPHNKAVYLSPIQAYASLMTSCSGMTWDKELADGKDYTLQQIISSTPCWVMECLPDEDAARVCMKAVTSVQK
jgi:hypothetical protein